MDKPTVADFKAKFDRDFPYGNTNQNVKDTDIQKALDEASISFNEALFGVQANYSLCYLYLSAHIMVENLRNSSQGIAGSFAWLEASKSAGPVSQSFTIPQHILDNPLLAMYSKTTYGAKYLELMLPMLVGQVIISCGRTHA